VKRRALKKRYGHAASSKKQFIDIRHGYRVTDAMATGLAGRGNLPDHGFETFVVLPGEIRAWLSRTKVSTDAYGFKPPKRGWVWYVRPSTQPEGNERKFYDYVRDR
jgi:hypothetical protein